jgi:hypothetical protein
MITLYFSQLFVTCEICCGFTSKKFFIREVDIYFIVFKLFFLFIRGSKFAIRYSLLAKLAKVLFKTSDFLNSGPLFMDCPLPNLRQKLVAKPEQTRAKIPLPKLTDKTFR